MTLVLHI